MNVKKPFIYFCINVLLVLGVCFGAYQCGAVNTRDSIGAEGRESEIRRAYTELGDEQRTNETRLERSAEILERIAGITEKTNRDVGELRESNRRSGGLLSLLEQKIDLLEDYFDSVQRELGNYRDSDSSSE